MVAAHHIQVPLQNLMTLTSHHPYCPHHQTAHQAASVEALVAEEITEGKANEALETEL